MPQNAELELVEQFSYRLPPGFQPRGITVDALERIATWSSTSTYVIHTTSGSHARIGEGVLVDPVGVAFVGNDVIEVVDAAKRMIISFEYGRVMNRRPVEVPGDILHGVRTAGGWLISTRRGESEYAVDFLPDWSRSRFGSRATRNLYEGPEEMHVVASDENILLTLAGNPHSIYKFSPSGRLQARFEHHPGRVVGAEDGLEFPPRWVAMPSIELGEGLVMQTIADIRSDRRVVALINPKGDIVRTRVLDLPIGFAASLPLSRLIVGVSNFDHPEIVGYRWRWTR